MSMALIAALQQLESNPGLHSLINLDKLNQYCRLIAHLKADIRLPQPLDESLDMPPTFLPRSIVQFLASTLSLTIQDVQASWDILHSHLWQCQVLPLIQEDYDAFKQFGWEIGLSVFFTLIS